MNNKGSSIAIIFFIIVASLTIIIISGVFLYGYDQIVTGLTSPNVMVGQVNLTNATLLTMGELNVALYRNADLFAVVILFGMFLGMMIAGYFTRQKYPKILFAVDIFILVFAYILATYLSNSYETILGSVPFASVYIDNLSTASQFVLKLPLIVTIAGVITMILSYASIPKTKEEEVANF